MMRRWWLVADREIRAQVRSKAYRISFAIFVLLGFGGAVFGGWQAKDSGSSADQASVIQVEVAVVGELPASAIKAGLVAEPVSNAEEAAQMVKDGQVLAAVIMGEADEPPVLLALEEEPTEVTEALTMAPLVQLLEPPKVNPAVRYVATFGCGILFFMVVTMFGQIAAQNTVVEKQTRVVEILLTAVPAKSLMAGKVIGNAALALAQVAGLLIAVFLGILVTGWTGLLGLVSSSIIWFLVLFIVGFVLFSSLLAGCAALVSRIEDIGSVQFPVLMLMMVPYMLVVSSPENLAMQKVLSFVPISSPMAMPARLITGTVDWWEPFLALAILAATTYGAILLGGRLYSHSVLHTGARLKWGQALKKAK